MDWSIRAARRGDGARCKPLWKPWQGSRYNEVMDSIDGRGPQNTVDNRLFIAEHRRGQVAGMVLTTPPLAVLLVRHGMDLQAIKADEAYTKAVKLAAVAVAPELRGQGLGTLLVQRAIEESALTAVWMYGQFDADRNIEGFYNGLGFRVHRQGKPLTGPYGCQLAGQHDERWFEEYLSNLLKHREAQAPE